MDPFEVRMQFLALLRRLNASQQSIQKVVTFAIKFFPPCGEDLWDCIVEECQKGSINSRINILYFLDSLCEGCLRLKPAAILDPTKSSSLYVDFVARDLGKIVELVVPSGREGLPNLISTQQILESWRSKRIVDPQIVEQVVSSLSSRDTAAASPSKASSSTSSSTKTALLPRHEIIKRIEEDRERHKRLRERRWVQPMSHSLSPTPPPLSFMPLTEKSESEYELTADVEFDNEWETVSDWNEDDDEACKEENELCFPGEQAEEEAMDLD
ncbi:CTD kinase subunit gamma CTK3-domain-containing protein [Mycena floridula]|nr:CTD kinase subunit gamma CTK3-domain-containing protein [Mycena floridula]